MTCSQFLCMHLRYPNTLLFAKRISYSKKSKIFFLKKIDKFMKKKLWTLKGQEKFPSNFSSKTMSYGIWSIRLQEFVLYVKEFAKMWLMKTSSCNEDVVKRVVYKTKLHYTSNKYFQKLTTLSQEFQQRFLFKNKRIYVLLKCYAQFHINKLLLTFFSVHTSWKAFSTCKIQGGDI